RSLNAFAAPDRCTVSRHDALPISAFDDVAALVGEGVEGWWTAAGLAAPTSVGSLVAPLGDGGRDVPPAEFSADGLGGIAFVGDRSEEHTSELQSREKLVCRLPLEE